MIYFIYGEDSYRVKEKLEEIILGYKKVHESGLNLVYFNAVENNFKDFYSNLQITSMFAEKKLIVLNNVFDNDKFQEDFLDNIKSLESIKDIIVICEDRAPDQRTKFFKALQKGVKCQEFSFLQPAMLRRWILLKFSAQGGPASGWEKTRINPDAVDLMIARIGGDLWEMANEVGKLSNYKAGSIVKKEDVELLVRPNIENDIFKTIDALVSKDKKLALSLLHKHLDGGEAPLRLLAMISYQFRNLLVIKELQDMGVPYPSIAKKSGLHPFVVQKVFYMCNQFSMAKLKKIYQKIFQVDTHIKIGKVEPETALDLLLSEI